MQSTLIDTKSQQSEPSQTYKRQQGKPIEPKKQQWALIYNHQTQQYKRMKQIQKRLNLQKVERYKNEIEKQLHNKSSSSVIEKEEDKKFYQYIKMKNKQQQQKQKSKRLSKLLQRRRIEQQNYQKSQQVKKSRIYEGNLGIGLNIGQRSDLDKKRQYYLQQKQLTDALDKQMLIKQQQKINEKLNDSMINELNNKYLNEYYIRRQATGPRRKQNQDVYRYFQRVNEQKQMKNRELQHKIVDEVIQKKQQQQAQKQKQKRSKKQHLNYQVKKTLDDQIRYKSEQNLKQKRYNPQQNSYQIIGGIFKDKKQAYDKRQYFEFLAKQAEQQNYNKKKWDYMNEHQYRLNMNQLNKAITGNYEHQRYIDRTVNTIGQNKLKGVSSASFDFGEIKNNNDEDLQAVNYKLQQIRRRKQENSMKNSGNLLKY